jgi:putative AlgH/UPF0301 family transcriptional regulator
MMRRQLLWMGVMAVLLPATADAQSTRIKDLGAGKFLVASRNLPDPNFSKAVILLVQYNEQGAMGLTVNRRTKVPLSRIFREPKEAKVRSDPVYAGGPVGRTGVLALLRSRNKPEDASHVFADIYMISSKTLLEKTMAAGTEPSMFHVYLGYAGWGAEQLEKEVELGAWHIFRGDAAMVFDPDPDSVWFRLIQQTDLRLATAGKRF